MFFQEDQRVTGKKKYTRKIINGFGTEKITQKMFEHKKFGHRCLSIKSLSIEHNRLSVKYKSLGIKSYKKKV